MTTLKPTYISDFEPRQQMQAADFEIFHYFDAASCNVAPHRHDFYELYCLLSDRMDYIVEGVRYTLSAGSLLLIAPGELHRPDIPHPAHAFERIVLWLNEDFVASLTGALPRIKRTLTDGLDGRNLIALEDDTLNLVESLLYALLREKQQPDADSATLSRLIVTQLLVYLNRCLTRSPRPAQDRAERRDAGIMRIYEYIGAHLGDNLSVAGLAELFFMDKNTLTRQFKRLVGMTPGECIRRQRLAAAHAMIQGGAGMQEACAECGFSDYSAFYRAFRQAYGLSPSCFAAMWRGAKPSAKNRQE